jgi:signal transduction histidine kinase
MSRSTKQEHKAHGSRYWKQAQGILEILSSLSYRAGELSNYLQAIALGVSRLLELDWSVVTFCRDGKERVMASSLDLGEGEHVYSLHGLLTNTVIQIGQTLTVEDATVHPEYGEPPEGYCAYLGVPLRTSEGEVIGTICSFCRQPRQFTLEEVHTVELFAERAATALDNYLLYQQQRQFNDLLEAEVARRTEELKATQAQLIKQERLAAIGEFAATIVHEVRNPLTTITMGLNYFQKTYPSERDRLRASLALDEAHRLQNLLQEILLYAKPQTLTLEELEVNEWLAKILEELREIPEATDRQMIWMPLPNSLKIRCDRDKIKQVMINLLRNACEAIASGETVTCKVEQDPSTSCACIHVHNGGTPIPADILPKLTQPFCSTKAGGTGLGLAIVKRIVEAHGGKLSIQSDAARGTLVSFTLPVVFSGGEER